MGEKHDVIREVANSFGINLDDDDIDAYAADTASICERLQRLDPPVRPDPRPESVSESPGPGAFRYRCRLPGGQGHLSDLEVAVKDCIAVAGVPMTCGSTGVLVTPRTSATVTRRLVEAGADIVGTTNMDAFALSPTGQTCAHGRIENPAAAGCIPGGSSSGSAAAVAVGDVDAALGSDTGGSIRIPAALCGVVGFKPTHATVPRSGFVDLAPSLDHVGPLARDVATATRTLDAIAGPSPEDPSSLGRQTLSGLCTAIGESVEDLRVGVIDEAMVRSEDAVAETVRDGVTALSEAGVTVESVSIQDYQMTSTVLLGTLSPEFSTLVRAGGQIYGTGTGDSSLCQSAMTGATAHGEYGDVVRDSLLLGAAVTELTHGERYAAAQNARQELTATIESLFERFDALVGPTTPIPAPPFGAVGDSLALVEHTALFNLTGHPALSVPVGHVDGKPVGIQIATRRYGEAAAVRLGTTIESGVVG
ncbi:amidase [Salinibaculum salinum]|uniref:amidase n=1 Tax=Salinibaculum salinum TaxID=3131996 RepID=UPI0030EB8A17